MLIAQLRDDLGLSRPRGWAFVTFQLLYCALIAFGICSSALGVAQAFGWHPVPEWNSDHPAGFLFNSTAQGEFLALCVVALASFRVWWPVAALVPGLYLADSRGAWAALALGLLTIWFRRPLWLLILVLAFSLAWTWHPGPHELQRLVIWNATWSQLTLWGHGWGSFWNLWIGNPTTGAWWPQYVHNDYLQTVFEFGLWAVVPFSVLAWALSRTSSPSWPVLVAFAFLGTFSMPLHIPLVLALGALALTATLLGEPNA